MEDDRRSADRAGGIDLLVVGEINPDVMVTGPDLNPVFNQTETLVDSISLCPGSSSVITACGAAKLGLRTSFSGAVGDDAFGRYMLDEMSRRGLDTSGCLLDPVRPTGVSLVFSKPDDRATLTSLGAMAAFRSDQVPVSLLRAARHVHLGSYFLQAGLRKELPGLFATIHDFGATTSFDCNWDPSGAWDGIADLLPATDIFFLNEREAQMITGKESAVAAVRTLLGIGGEQLTVVVKLGPRGALAGARESILEVPAPRMDVVDTTGAGDCFNAGFLYGRLSGWRLPETLRLAVACGSLATLGMGGVQAQPTLDDALAAVRRSGLPRPHGSAVGHSA